MKQHITKTQWDELTQFQRETFDESLDFAMRMEEVEGVRRLVLPRVGELIEFLEDDLFEVGKADNWFVKLNDDAVDHLKRPVEDKRGKELVDLLWKAVKYKLG
jgi:L-lactate utilization protein LutB|tara:strand:- start:232 stop:540 length:309 start_codon:yes stop_codon:yes gene_type:complete